MKKSKLGRLPVLAASCADVERTGIQPGIKWLMKAEVQKSGEEEYLVVNFYDRDDLEKGSLTPCYRTFFTHDGYITQALGRDGGRWRTGRREYIMYEGFKWSTEAASIDDSRIICNYFRDYKSEGYSCNPVRMIDVFQQNILRKKLEERHRKTMDRIDSEMQGITAMPPEFEAWVDEDAMEHSRYFFYKYERKTVEEGICSCCGKKSRVLSRNIRYRKQIPCPNCGKVLTALAEGRMPERIYDRADATAVQNVEGKTVLRYFHIHKRYKKGEPGKCVPEIFEYARQIHQDGVWKEYEWNFFKSSGKVRWCDSQGRMDITGAVLWTDGIGKALKGTPFEYSALEEYALHRGGRSFDVWRYLFRAQKYPWVEKLVKCGFWKLADDSVDYYSMLDSLKLMDGTKRKLFQIFKVSHSYFSGMPRDITPQELIFCQACFKKRINVDSDLWAMCRENGIHHEVILEYSEYAPVKKIIRYLAGKIRQLDEAGPSQKDADNLIRSWGDYLGWCRALGYDLHDEYYLMPAKLGKAHDRMNKEYREYLDKKKKKEMKAARIKATKCLKQAGERIGVIERGGFQIIVPRSSKEIIEEGKKLHHCVGSYIPQVANKSTLILFLRRKNEPEQPFRTLEWRDNEFKQCQGRSNSEKNGKEIEDFLDYAQKKLVEQMHAGKAV